MSRIKQCFEQLKDGNKTALIPFITAGDPEPGVTVPLMHTLVESGADMIELGVPFSDPMADGPVIQRASERALEHHVSLHDVLRMVTEFRQQNQDTPVVLMGYLNPIEVMGYQEFAQSAAAAGVDGALTVDIPPEEGHDLVQALKNAEVDPIFLAAPTSNQHRLKLIAGAGSGFIYYVSLKGVTGSANLVLDEVAGKLAQIRELSDLPLGVGFGIKDAEMASRMAKISDAVIVGSALVSRIEEHRHEPREINRIVGQLVAGMRQAMDN